MRAFGIELEFTSNYSRDLIAQAIANNGVTAVAENYNHRTRGYWKVITDSSCGYEIVSPVLYGEDGIEQIRKVCDALDGIANVDRNCGFHIHIDANGLNLRQIKDVVKSYKEYEDIFDLVLPRSRRANNNQYCKSLEDVTLSEIDTANNIRELVAGAFGNDRYYKLNIASYLRHGTIEIRQHSGTVDADKVINWVYLIQNFVARSINNEIKANTQNIRDRFNALIPETATFQSIDNTAIVATANTAANRKLKDIKSDIYQALGVTTTKQVKAIAKRLNFNGDLRKKASWIALLALITASRSSSNNVVSLREFYVGRTQQLGTYAAIA